jgi:H/ACA ribonucleoprotein complex subunit 2
LLILFPTTAAASRTLKRGVKEVVKALRKSPADTSNTVSSIVILAADISPMDVISHIPVLCEDHNVPYIYVASRAELGIAGQTKRPTSVVLLGREGSGKGKGSEGEEWGTVFDGLVKVLQREGGRVKV